MNINIPSRVRQWAYIVLGALGAGQGAAYASFAAIQATPPDWLIAGSAAYASLVAAPFVVAVLNISKDDPVLRAVVIPADEGDGISDTDLGPEPADPAAEANPARDVEVA